MRIPKINKMTDNDKGVVKEVKLIKDFPSYNSVYGNIREKLVEDNKYRIKFIKNIEKYVRGSNEYKDFVKFLRDEIDMNQCLFFPNINRKEVDVRLEIHHEPFTLFDIVSIVLNKKINSSSPINSFEIAEEVIELHFRGLVGLIPLSLTVHELVHAGEIFVPLNTVYGDIGQFIREYRNAIDNELIERVKDILFKTETVGDGYKPKVLERKNIYLKVDGQEKVSSLEIEKEKIG